MRCTHLLLVGLLSLACTTAALANDAGTEPPAQEGPQGAWEVTRAVVYVPFKGLMCAVGTVTAFPPYWFSGLDPHVQTDTTAMRTTYCSPTYLWSPHWAK